MKPKPTTAPRVRYEQATAVHATQVIVNSVEETVFLDCSSGFVVDDSDAPVLPIHTRLAITRTTARDLGELLISVADELEADANARSLNDVATAEGVSNPGPATKTPSAPIHVECEEALLDVLKMHCHVEQTTSALPRIDRAEH